ncbi:MAG: winged helix-turn-helix domain-containing protein [Nanobdellota archaeon]
MKKIIIALSGDNLNNLFIGINEFSVESVILLSHEKKEKITEDMKEKLLSFKTQVKVDEIDTLSWEAVFNKVNEIKKSYGAKKILIDVSTGNSTETALMTSAAFVNGIMAFSVEKQKVVMLPVLKFSYYKIVPEKKMKILKLLYEKKSCCASLEDLSKETNMSVPLISYHINGTNKNKGLKELGLVDTKESSGKIGLQLSLQGRLLVQGCL